MSNKPGKDQGIAHRVFDEIVKFKTSIITDIGKFKTEVINNLKDFAEKHNELSAMVFAQQEMIKNVSGFVGSELGQRAGDVDVRFASVAKSIRGTDLNILAMAELLKEVVGQLTQTDFIFRKMKERSGVLFGNKTQEDSFMASFDLTPEEVEQVKSEAEEWYKDLIRSAFKTGQEKMVEQERQADEAYEAAQKKAKEDAAKTAAAQDEKSIEEELKKASEDERALSASTTGGPGSQFPEGAEIFGG